MTRGENPATASSEALAERDIFWPTANFAGRGLVSLRGIARMCFRGCETHRHYRKDLGSGCCRPDVGDFPLAQNKNGAWFHKESTELADFLEPYVMSKITDIIPDGHYNRLERSIYNSSNLAKIWVMNKPDVVALVRELEANKCISINAVMTSAFIRELDKIERIDRLITVAESRRNSVFREIERRRATFAQLLRDKVQDVQDAEFETIEPKSISQNNKNKNAA